ncbi:MAG: HDIG domain-containing protein [Prolixibacteraceae bacterium]|nr:HDIG domain-containing protein [Prolixibacteraceae bacterium]MBN2772665.1 HDIG domain-containing protein [Prolixibacteraceae bacterium]
MKSYTQNIKKYSRIFYQVFIFILAAFLLQLIMPGEPIFKFEYQKGSPWRHENLMAPFDFAILKTDAEIGAEKQEKLKSLPAYFMIDTATSNSLIESFYKSISTVFDTSQTDHKNLVHEMGNKLKEILNTGVLQHSPDTYDVLKGKDELARIKGNVSVKIPVNEIFSEKTAYNYFSQYINRITTQVPELHEKVSEIDISVFIKQNLQYDEATELKQKDEAFSGISLTQGMVQSGERIILNGEIVDEGKYKILESLKESYREKQGEGFNKYMITAGKTLLIVILLTLVFIFLRLYRQDILNQFRRLIFLFFLIVMMVFISIFANSRETLHIYLVPIAILPIFIRTFYDSRTAIYIHIITTLLIGLYAPNSFEYILIQVIAGMVAVFSLAHMHRRVHLVMATLWVLISYIVSYSALNTIQEGSVLNINYPMFLWFAGSCLLLNLAYPIIYIFEKLFGFVSDVTLIELSDTNQPLLRKLAEEAPGTFQHSMQIANLAEEVILKIGGNPFLVRAGSLYHDIGKIAKADYFTENQFGIENPHNSLDHEKSAEIIIDHVKNGIKLAKKHKLPESLIEFIATHHGTSKAKYFYLKQKELFPKQKPDERKFIYPGPLPKSKEATVVMLVDGIEAASRSLNDKNRDNLKELVDRMIDNKVSENQLINSNLTFSDINTIKEVILNKLLNIYHVRIAYPNEKKI